MNAIPPLMQAIDVDQANPARPLVFSKQPIPTIGADEVLVRVRAFGVNRADLAQRAGHYPAPAGESTILGLEVAGDVVAIGDEVDEVWLHRPVFGLVPGGGYAEYARLHRDQLMLISGELDYVKAAACAEVFLTAYQALFTIGHCQPEHAVLLHAGASGVGTAAIQLAKAIGATVAVTASSAEKLAFCRSLGADVAVSYQQGPWDDVLVAAQPHGFHVIVDPVAGGYIEKDIRVLAQDGTIVVLAMMGGRQLPPLDLALMFKKRGRLQCSTLRNRDASYKQQLVAEFEHRFGNALRRGDIKPVIADVMSWQMAEQAHQQLAENQTIGKLVLTIDQP